jgi:DnaK suppressor protein
MTLSAEDLQQYAEQLRSREQQLLSELREGRQRAESATFERIAGEAPDAGDSSVADAVTDGVNAERERDKDELREVQDALGRIEQGSYGLCQLCGEQIDPRRLRAFPTARYDIVHQQQLDRQRGTPATPTL